ncbi:unnamed protein product [Closterium sp. NIES-54]
MGKVGDASVFRGPAPLGVSQVDPLLGPVPVQVAGDSGAARGAASRGAEPRGAESEGDEPRGVETGGADPGGVASEGGEPEGVEPGGAEPEGVEPGDGASEGVESGGAEPQGAPSSRVSAGSSPSLSPQQLREWFVQRTRLQSGASGARGDGAAGAGGPGVAAVAGVTGDTATTGPRGARTRGTGAAGTCGVGARDPTESGTTRAGGAGVGGPGVGGAGAGGAGAVDPGGAVRLRPYFVPLLQQVLGTPPSAALTSPLSCPPPDQSQPPLQPAPPLPAPSPYIEQSSGLTERREPASRLVTPVRTVHRVPRLRPPPVPGTHAMTLRPFSVPLRSAAASALAAELLEFAAACRLDYATALIAEFTSKSPPSVGGECALGTDVLEDRQEDFKSLATAVPRFASMLLAPEGDPDAPDIPTPRSYAEAITGSPPAFKARYVARGLSQRQGVDYFHTFSPTLKMTTLRVLLHVAAQRDYELHSLDFSTAFLQGSLHEEIWTTLAALGFARATADPSLFLRTDTSLPLFYILLYVKDLVLANADTEALTLVKSELQKRHTCTDLGELRSYLGLQITRDRARRTITLTQSHMVHQVLSALQLPVLLATAHSSVYQPLTLSSTFGRVRRAECTSGMGLVLGGRGPVVLTGHADASWVDDSATQRSSQGYTFSLGSGSVSWRSTRSSLVLSSSCEAEIYAGAMAAQELRWLTYL